MSIEIHRLSRPSLGGGTDWSIRGWRAMAQMFEKRAAARDRAAADRRSEERHERWRKVNAIGEEGVLAGAILGNEFTRELSRHKPIWDEEGTDYAERQKWIEEAADRIQTQAVDQYGLSEGAAAHLAGSLRAGTQAYLTEVRRSQAKRQQTGWQAQLAKRRNTLELENQGDLAIFSDPTLTIEDMTNAGHRILDRLAQLEQLDMVEHGESNAGVPAVAASRMNLTMEQIVAAYVNREATRDPTGDALEALVKRRADGTDPILNGLARTVSAEFKSQAVNQAYGYLDTLNREHQRKVDAQLLAEENRQNGAVREIESIPQGMDTPSLAERVEMLRSSDVDEKKIDDFVRRFAQINEKESDEYQMRLESMDGVRDLHTKLMVYANTSTTAQEAAEVLDWGLASYEGNGTDPQISARMYGQLEKAVMDQLSNLQRQTPSERRVSTAFTRPLQESVLENRALDAGRTPLYGSKLDFFLDFVSQESFRLYEDGVYEPGSPEDRESRSLVLALREELEWSSRLSEGGESAVSEVTEATIHAWKLARDAMDATTAEQVLTRINNPEYNRIIRFDDEGDIDKVASVQAIEQEWPGEAFENRRELALYRLRRMIELLRKQLATPPRDPIQVVAPPEPTGSNPAPRGRVRPNPGPGNRPAGGSIRNPRGFGVGQ